MRKEQIKLQRELNATSAQDDFAKWAKIRRNLDKATADHDKICMLQKHSLLLWTHWAKQSLQAQSVQSSRASFDSKANTLRFVLTTGARMGIGFAYTKQPMFWLPKGWVPYYVEWILSFPKAPIGAVSIQVWLAACGAVINLVGKALAAAGVLALGSVQQAKLEKAKAKAQAEKTKEKKEL